MPVRKAANIVAKAYVVLPRKKTRMRVQSTSYASAQNPDTANATVAARTSRGAGSSWSASLSSSSSASTAASAPSLQATAAIARFARPVATSVIVTPSVLMSTNAARSVPRTAPAVLTA